MAQTGYTPIQLYRSSTASAAPTAGNLADGELAINITDGKLYYKDNLGVVQVLANKNIAGLTLPLSAANGGTGQSSYAVGDILYASATTTLSKLTLGTSGQVLTAGASAPQYVNQSSLSVGSANNVNGGTAGAIVYQNGAGSTTFLNLGTAGYVLTAGATAPEYTALSSLSIGTATNLAGGTTGAIPYQSGAGATTFLSLGTAGFVLTAGASAPQYTAQSSLSVGSAAVATNVSGGTAGALLYNSGANTTTFLSLGTTNYVLTAGATAPQYVDQSTLSVGNATTATTATTATNLAGGANGSIPYQTGSGSTTFLAAGTNGYVLTLAAGVPTWAAPTGGGGGGGGSTSRNVTDFTATNGQTTFTVAYTVGLLDVYRNGVKLAASDVTATNGTSFTIAACATGDIVQAVAYSALSVAATISSDLFSGNGSTTAFTMSTAPANTSSALVAISGVVQDPSTYTVSGTTLTFSVAPPTGTNNISVRYLGIASATAPSKFPFYNYAGVNSSISLLNNQYLPFNTYTGASNNIFLLAA